MSGLELHGITKVFGNVTAVSDINLTLPEGKFISFLGPSPGPSWTSRPPLTASE